MTVKKTWKIVKNRYRLATKIQMNFELSFPQYLIGKCRITTNNTNEDKTQKVALSTKGIVFSDTIPLSWFTSSVLIPYEKILKIRVDDSTPPIDEQDSACPFCSLQISDPMEMTIRFPWSDDFTRYLQKNKIFDI